MNASGVPKKLSIVLSLVLAAATSAQTQTSPRRSTREPGAGLLYYAKADYAFAENQSVIANPHIIGAMFQVIWSEVEKKDGECNWREVDQWLKPWRDASDRIFQHTPLLVTLNVGGLRVSDRLITIGDYCASRGFYVGQNGLGGGSYRDSESGRTQAFLRWAGQSKLFFEMAQKSGGRTGTLVEVMQAAERIHCSYLNVYPEDVLRGTRGEKNFDPAFEAALKYGAEMLRRRISDARSTP